MINWIYNIHFSVSRGCLTCPRTTLCVLVSWCPPAHTATGPPPPPTAPSTPCPWCPPGTAGPTEIPTVRPAMARTSMRPSAPQAGPSQCRRMMNKTLLLGMTQSGQLSRGFLWQRLLVPTFSYLLDLSPGHQDCGHHQFYDPLYRRCYSVQPTRR